MQKMLLLVAVTITFALASCSKQEVKPVVKDIAEENVEALPGAEKFDLQRFYVNPFEKAVYVPKVLAKSLTELTAGHEKELKVVEEKVVNQEYTNGYYFRTTIANDRYKAIYISPYSKDNYLRNNLIVSGNNTRLKYHLFIGMKTADLLRIIEDASPQHFESSKFESYYIQGEEIQIHFVISKGLVTSLQVQIGD